MAIDYKEIDAEILQCIRNGRRDFGSIWGSQGVKDACIKAFGVSNPDAYRVTDRRLQSLRKRGLIAHCTGIWSLVQP